jgi:hypothetical protein
MGYNPALPLAACRFVLLTLLFHVMTVGVQPCGCPRIYTGEITGAPPLDASLRAAFVDGRMQLLASFRTPALTPTPRVRAANMAQVAGEGPQRARG